MADDTDFGKTLRELSGDQLVFGRFRLKRILGRGGMGVVWLGWDEKLDEEVALKFMPENVRLDEVAIHDLKKETRKSRQLTHPSIVRIHDFFEGEETAAIAMEYVDGQTLSSLRLQQPGQVFQPSKLEGWIRQLGAALSYAHETGRVVHRDLKPANLMINSRGQLKVTDFGISSAITDSMSRISMPSMTSGSPPYMSPQQLSGQAPSASDDIYSLGATLYELLTGKPPFYRGNIVHQVMEVIPRPVSEQRAELTGDQVGLEPIPPEWERGIARCLAKTPGERPKSVSEAISEILGESSAPSGVTTQILPTQPRFLNAWKRGWPLAAGAVVLLMGIGGFMTYKARSHQPEKPQVKPSLVEQTPVPIAAPHPSSTPIQTITSSPPANPSVLSPDLLEIVKLSQSHASDESIINFIKSSGKSYNLGVDSIIALGTQGISQGVIAALQNSTKAAAQVATPQTQPTLTKTEPVQTALSTQPAPLEPPAKSVQLPPEDPNPMVAAFERLKKKIEDSITPAQFVMVKKIWTRMAMQSARSPGKPLKMIGVKVMGLPSMGIMILSPDGVNLNTKKCNLSRLPDNLQMELGDADPGSWIFLVGQAMPYDDIKALDAKVLSPSEMDAKIREVADFYNMENAGQGEVFSSGKLPAASIELKSHETAATSTPWQLPKPGDPLYDVQKEAQTQDSAHTHMVHTFKRGVFIGYSVISLAPAPNH